MNGAFAQYLEERFPVGPYILLIGAMVAAATAAACLDQGAVPLGWRQGLVLVSLMAGFFHLRVFDEHKDYDKDLIAHPDRVLSRGLITLADLRRAGAIAIAVELVIGVVLGWHALAWTVGFIVFSVLMRYEFFVGEWLNRHIVLYAISHNPIVAIMMTVAFVAALGTTRFTDGALWFLGVATFTSLGFEVGRKVRAPADEKDGQDTYSRAIGPGRAALLIVVIELLAVVTAWPLLASTAARITLVVLGLVMLVTPLAYARNPTPGLAKGVENASTLGALGIYLAIVIDIGVRQGVTLAA